VRSSMINKKALKQLQELQAKLARAQQELEEAVLEGSSGGGAVKVEVSGKPEVLSVKIAPEVIDPQDASLLEDLILAAVNQALEKARNLAARRLEPLAGGLKFPGLF